MKPEALVLLEGDLEAQRMVVTWEDVAAAVSEVPEEPGAGLGEELITVWAAQAGLQIDAVWRLAPMLVLNKICHTDGTVDETAMGYIRGRLAGMVKNPKEKKKGR